MAAMNTTRIQKAKQFLFDVFADCEGFKDDPDGKRYRFQHSMRVANIARIIAENENLDTEALMIASILHDIGYCKPFSETHEWKHHGLVSAEVSLTFLTQLGFSGQLLDDMLTGISGHDTGEPPEGKSFNAFSGSIMDADIIDHQDVYRIYECMSDAHFENLSDEDRLLYIKEMQEEIDGEEEHPFFTKTGQKLFNDKIAYKREFFRRLTDQLSISELKF